MQIIIKRFQVYGDLLRANARKLLKDAGILALVVAGAFWIERLTAGMSIRLFAVDYRLSILLLYLLGFVFITTAGMMFRDLKSFLDIVSRFVISRFPRMHGDLSPGKRIFRDLVQVMLLILIFYPISGVIESASFVGIQLRYVTSLFFLLLTLIFVYDIIINISAIITSQARKIASALQLKESMEDGQ